MCHQGNCQVGSKMECHQGEGMSLAELRSHTVMGCDLHIATAVSS